MATRCFRFTAPAAVSRRLTFFTSTRRFRFGRTAHVLALSSTHWPGQAATKKNERKQLRNNLQHNSARHPERSEGSLFLWRCKPKRDSSLRTPHSWCKRAALAV